MADKNLSFYEEKYGLVFPGARGLATDDNSAARRARVALDAAAPNLYPGQQASVTNPNAGIPAFLMTFVDPELVRVSIAPTKAAEILGEEKKGDWEDVALTFPMVESAGETSSYGDDSENGMADSQLNWEYRQPYMYQCITKWGELEMARAGKAKVDWASEQNIASAEVMRVFENLVYFFGLKNLQNYGLLNDPALPPSIVPGTKVAGGTSWTNATTKEIFQDFEAVFTQAQIQTAGLLEATDAFTWAMSPSRAAQLSRATDFNVSVLKMLKDAYPASEVKTAVQYSTPAGELMQLIPEKIDGKRVGFCSFTEKLRSHPIIQGLSNYKQKKSAGVTGAIITLIMEPM